LASSWRPVNSTGPGEETIQFLKLDPAFDELRAHPGDQELVAGR